MINTITGGRYITVQNGSGASNYVNHFPGALNVGQMRYNTTSQNIEVYDGNNWMPLSMNHAQVELSNEASMLLDWAREQQARQLRRSQLIRNNPALQKAWEAIQRAEANFDLIEKFVENDADYGQVQASP